MLWYRRHMAFLFGYMLCAAIIGTVTIACFLILSCMTLWRIITVKLDTLILLAEIRAHLTNKETQP